MKASLSRSLLAAIAIVAAAVAITTLATRTSGEPAASARIDGKPNFNGVWQALNEANWDLQAHEARAGAVTQPGVYPYPYARVPAAPVLALGAAGGVPASVGVVSGDGEIPYTADAAAKKKDNAEHWIDRDPELKCYVPGTPRAMYLNYPLQIVQSTNKIHVDFAFANAARTIHLDEVDEPPADTAMGFSRGRWDGGTLVVDTKQLQGNWLDRAGNFYSETAHMVERFTPISNDAIRYEVTIEDPHVFTRPWTISMPLYRRLESNAQLLEYPCVEFVEEFMYGDARSKQLVKHWEGDSIVIDITRKMRAEGVR
ncbi:MAG: hypothetical protein DMF87_19380 [Acidobacteria bacterium]|nr:MAG: hypothetical protein DMF87_19380 [Acidobacteriota bacterium]